MLLATNQVTKTSAPSWFQNMLTQKEDLDPEFTRRYESWFNSCTDVEQSEWHHYLHHLDIEDSVTRVKFMESLMLPDNKIPA